TNLTAPFFGSIRAEDRQYVHAMPSTPSRCRHAELATLVTIPTSRSPAEITSNPIIDQRVRFDIVIGGRVRFVEADWATALANTRPFSCAEPPRQTPRAYLHRATVRNTSIGGSI